uniref:SH2 domain-containing protein n=1 Tax=Salarias fasciatus TaxID=181472 RepID=A0A672IYQ2_SALFA
MSAEMTPGSNFSLVISREEIDRNCCCLCRPLKYRSETTCYFSESRLKNHKQEKSPIVRTCLKVCVKDRARMEQQEPKDDSKAERTERKVRELASQWFLETQLPLMVTSGLLPTWFLGFISRKEAEEILREKELGCFLIRLSDKAIGYILSYRGRDRCRHFVVNQNESGQIVICGDTTTHNTVPNLVDYYKKNPIQPFGEYLTSSCFETMNPEIYDTIQVSPKLRPPAAERALKNMKQQHQVPLTSEQQPARPLKSNRTQEQEVPPLPRRSRHLEPGLLDHVLYAQLKKQSPRQKHRAAASQDALHGAARAEPSNATDGSGTVGRCSLVLEPHSVYSEVDLPESRSRSLPLLDSSRDGEQPHRLSTPPSTPPKLSPKPVRPLSGCVSLLERTGLSSRASSSHSLNHTDDSAIYHLASGPAGPHGASGDTRSAAPEQDGDSVYAEILCEVPADRFPADRTYEMIPGAKEPVSVRPNSHHHKPAEEAKRKHSHSSWGLKNDKWKWLFPEMKRK